MAKRLGKSSGKSSWSFRTWQWRKNFGGLNQIGNGGMFKGFSWDLQILMGFSWNFMGFSWDFMGFSWDFMGFSWDFMGFLWDVHGISWHLTIEMILKGSIDGDLSMDKYR